MIYGAHEIVQVLGDAFLLTSTWRMCGYVTRDRQPLRPGFYFVLWPAPTDAPGYDRDARYVGPLPSRKAAEALTASAIAFGMIRSDSTAPAEGRGRIFAWESMPRKFQNRQPGADITV